MSQIVQNLMVTTDPNGETNPLIVDDSIVDEGDQLPILSKRSTIPSSRLKGNELEKTQWVDIPSTRVQDTSKDASDRVESLVSDSKRL